MTSLRWAAAAALFVVLATLAWSFGRNAGQWSTESRPATAQTQAPTTRSDVRDSWQRIVDRGAGSSRSTVSRARPGILPAGPFGANVDELKRRAGEGDAGAAKALAEGYRRCESYVPPRDHANLEKRVEDGTVAQLNLIDQLVDQANEKARQRGEAKRIAEQASTPAYQAEMKAEQEMAEACDGVDTGDAKKWVDWYARAAELGDISAELGYWWVAFSQADIVPLDELQREKIAAANYVQDALSRGDWRALAAIGSILQVGYYGDPDPFLAHAYAFAASQAAVADITILPWMSGALRMRIAAGNDTQIYLQRMLQRTAMTLDPQQIAQSEQMGAALYASCCAGGPR
jgi:hypothetical protein